MPNETSGLRERIWKRDLLKGSFVKFTDPATVEIFGGVGFDFVVIDQEHGLFDRAATNMALLAAKAAGIAGVVRVPSVTPDTILPALDGGASGILAPHIVSAEDARQFVAACRFKGGRRGFSAGTRAGGYGARAMWDHVRASDSSVATVAMIEDPDALDNLEDILAVEGLDAVFVGRGDLTAAIGAMSRDDGVVRRAVDSIFDAASRSEMAVWIMVDSGAAAEDFRARGASGLIFSSDQGLLRKAAVSAANALLISRD